VTFQLLIFFMVSAKFKTLDGLLSAYMPRNEGPQDSRVDPSLPVRVVLRWNPSIGRCKVYVGQVLCNYDEQGLVRARSRVRQILSTGVMKAEIDAAGDVPMYWVIQSLNMLVETQVKQINFTGSMNPLGDNR
jgi:biopolymer transport protein ExbD